MRLVLLAVGALFLLEAGAGCGGDEHGDPSLEGVPWILSAGVDVAGWEAFAPSLRFEDGRLGGSSGCNRYGGPYTLDGEQLELGELASTLMACPPPADAVERAYLGPLARAARWRVEGGELALLDVEGVELLRFVAATPVGSWQATGFLRGDAVTSPIAGADVVASFAEDGTLAGYAGCNTYRSRYTIDGDAIAIEPPAATRKHCAEPAGVMEQEAAYLAALAQAERFAVGGGALELQRADGTSVAVFARRD